MKPEDVPERWRNLYRRAMSGKSRQAAIKCFCIMCVAWVSPEVERCTATTCPLYKYRPRTRASGHGSGNDSTQRAGVVPKVGSKRNEAKNA